MRRLILLAATCAVPGVLLAQAPSPAAASAAPAAKPEKEKKICRREETTGSIMPTRICHTKDEWVQIDEANAHAAEQFNAARRTGHGMSGGGN